MLNLDYIIGKKFSDVWDSSRHFTVVGYGRSLSGDVQVYVYHPDTRGIHEMSPMALGTIIEEEND